MKLIRVKPCPLELRFLPNIAVLYPREVRYRTATFSLRLDFIIQLNKNQFVQFIHQQTVRASSEPRSVSVILSPRYSLSKSCSVTLIDPSSANTFSTSLNELQFRSEAPRTCAGHPSHYVNELVISDLFVLIKIANNLGARIRSLDWVQSTLDN